MQCLVSGHNTQTQTSKEQAAEPFPAPALRCSSSNRSSRLRVPDKPERALLCQTKQDMGKYCLQAGEEAPRQSCWLIPRYTCNCSLCYSFLPAASKKNTAATAPDPLLMPREQAKSGTPAPLDAKYSDRDGSQFVKRFGETSRGLKQVLRAACAAALGSWTCPCALLAESGCGCCGLTCPIHERHPVVRCIWSI